MTVGATFETVSKKKILSILLQTPWSTLLEVFLIDYLQTFFPPLQLWGFSKLHEKMKILESITSLLMCCFCTLTAMTIWTKRNLKTQQYKLFISLKILKNILKSLKTSQVSSKSNFLDTYFNNWRHFGVEVIVSKMQTSPEGTFVQQRFLVKFNFTTSISLIQTYCAVRKVDHLP